MDANGGGFPDRSQAHATADTADGHRGARAETEDEQARAGAQDSYKTMGKLDCQVQLDFITAMRADHHPTNYRGLTARVSPHGRASSRLQFDSSPSMARRK